MRFWLLVCTPALALALAGCKEKKDGGDGTGEDQAQVDDDAARVENPSATAPADAAPAQTVVFFTDAHELVAPLGCYLAEDGVFASGEDCLKVVKLPTEVRDAAERRPRVVRRMVDVCEGDGAEFPALSFGDARRGRSAEVRRFAIWPADSSVELVLVERPSKSEIEIEPELRKRIARLHKHGARLRVDQRVRIDVDGDGATDELLSGAVPHEDPHEPLLLWSTLLLIDGADPDAPPRQLVTEDLSRVQVLGAIDLNGDGALELWLHSHYYEGSYQLLVRVGDDGELVTLGSHGCGA